MMFNHFHHKKNNIKLKMLANYLTLTEFELQVVLDWQQDQQSLLEIPR